MSKSQHAHRYKVLPGMLRDMREAAGLTQRGLAELLGVTHVWVHKSEVGERRVDITEFLDWCLTCGVEPERAIKDLRQRRGV
jgi:transcriptional regulator with XRE-family HTH domain